MLQQALYIFGPTTLALLTHLDPGKCSNCQPTQVLSLPLLCTCVLLNFAIG